MINVCFFFSPPQQTQKRSFRQLFYFDRYKRFVRRQPIHHPSLPHSLTHLNAYSHARYYSFAVLKHVMVEKLKKKKATFLALPLFGREKLIELRKRPAVRTKFCLLFTFSFLLPLFTFLVHCEVLSKLI